MLVVPQVMLLVLVTHLVVVALAGIQMLAVLAAIVIRQVLLVR